MKLYKRTICRWMSGEESQGFSLHIAYYAAFASCRAVRTANNWTLKLPRVNRLHMYAVLSTLLRAPVWCLTGTWTMPHASCWHSALNCGSIERRFSLELIRKVSGRWKHTRDSGRCPVTAWMFLFCLLVLGFFFIKQYVFSLERIRVAIFSPYS